MSVRVPYNGNGRENFQKVRAAPFPDARCQIRSKNAARAIVRLSICWEVQLLYSIVTLYWQRYTLYSA